jgi:hypothetical protein
VTPTLTFEVLISSIQTADSYFSAQAVRAINLGLILRNWCFGLYIAEFELRGEDRARYGEHLLDELSRKLKPLGISNIGRRQLYQYLAFYRTYPQIVRSLSAQSLGLFPDTSGLQEKVRSLAAQLTNQPDELVNRLSYTHFELLIGLEDDLRRRFYEAEGMDSQIFVSRYQMELPKKEDLERFLEAELKEQGITEGGK